MLKCKKLICKAIRRVSKCLTNFVDFVKEQLKPEYIQTIILLVAIAMPLCISFLRLLISDDNSVTCMSNYATDFTIFKRCSLTIFTHTFMRLGSASIIAVSAGIAHRSYINNRFYDLHKYFYSKDMLEARASVDKVVLLPKNDTRTENTKSFNMLNNFYPNCNNGIEKCGIEENINEEKFDLLMIDYKNILAFTNALNLACISYNYGSVPHEKFKSSIGTVLVRYYAKLKPFIKHRKELRKSSGTALIEVYMYKDLETTYHKLESKYKKPEALKKITYLAEEMLNIFTAVLCEHVVDGDGVLLLEQSKLVLQEIDNSGFINNKILHCKENYRLEDLENNIISQIDNRYTNQQYNRDLKFICTVVFLELNR